MIVEHTQLCGAAPLQYVLVILLLSCRRWIGRHTGTVRKLLAGSTPPAIDTLQTLEEDTELSQEEFKKLLETIDSGLRALPATAQVRPSSSFPAAGLWGSVWGVTSAPAVDNHWC